MQETKDHIALDEFVVRTLLYYDIFNYPLKASEVYQFLGTNHTTVQEVTHSLDALAAAGAINRSGEFYGIQPSEANIARRKKGNSKAQEFLMIAQKQARLIARFPFVRGVLASGSLSKNYMDDNSDLDFFVITASDHLWICRTLLVLYKRIVLRNSHKFFCVNYFISCNRPEIEERNLFTATELATVLPLYGAEYYHQLHQANRSWLLQFFPNFRPRPTENVPEHRPGFMKQIMEGMLSLLPLEKPMMKFTLNLWQRKYRKQYSDGDFRIAFKTTKTSSKNHPRHFQKWVMERYAEKLAEFKSRLKDHAA